MYVPFEKLSDESRLWVYGSKNKLSIKEIQFISDKLISFLDSWEYHQNILFASFKILESRFLIVGLDESKSPVGGCSIDGLQKLIQYFENELLLSLTDRLNVFCRIDNSIICIPLSELDSIVDKKTLFYDLTIQKKSDITTYLKPISKSWCNSFL